MGYGHAERNLALIRQLEAEIRELLGTLDQLDPEQSAWLQEVAGRAGTTSGLRSRRPGHARTGVGFGVRGLGLLAE
jgi:hypothetical protein